MMCEAGYGHYPTGLSLGLLNPLYPLPSIAPSGGLLLTGGGHFWPLIQGTLFSPKEGPAPDIEPKE